MRSAPSSKQWTRPPERPLRPDFYDTKSRVIEDKNICHIRFRGIAGNTHEDAHTFSAMDKVVLGLLEAERPDGLIMDFRELEYSWGDEMARTLGEHALPLVVIVSDLNRSGLTSLVQEEMLIQEASDLLVESEEAAYSLVLSKIRNTKNEN